MARTRERYVLVQHGKRYHIGRVIVDGTVCVLATCPDRQGAMELLAELRKADVIGAVA